MAKSRFKGKISRSERLISILSQAPHGFDKSKLPAWAQKEPTIRKPRAIGQKNAHEENTEQVAVVHYLHQCCSDVLVSASMNGEIGYIRRFMQPGPFMGLIAKFKAKGMLKGELDLMLTWSPSRIIFIEMKKNKGGVTSEAQEIIHKTRTEQGFTCYVLEGGVDGLKDIIKKEQIPCRDSSIGSF